VNELGKVLWIWLYWHWLYLLWLALVALVGYMVGLANPIYCARCHKHMTAEEALRARLQNKKERAGRDHPEDGPI
jgi:hypothetical protein